MQHSRRHARTRLLVLLASTALVAAGCGGGGGDDEDTSETTVETTTSTTAPVPAPLTGLILTDGSVAGRPAITIKVDNSPQGRPQSGIDKADVLIEERVEGGVTRFLAVFHSEDASLVGPVRSVRSTDPGLVAPLGGVFAIAGGIDAFEQLVRQQPVTVVSEKVSSKGFQYPPGKNRPFKTYTSVATLRDMAGDHDEPPPNLWDFLGATETFSPVGSLPATSVTIPFGRTTATLDFDAAAGVWKRVTNGTAHKTDGGTQLTFANVIVQKVQYRATRFTDPSGAQVDEAVVVGSGDAIVLSQGKQVAVKWSKPSATAVTAYTDSSGQAVKLAPGRTLVALPPTSAAVTVK